MCCVPLLCIKNLALPTPCPVRPSTNASGSKRRSAPFAGIGTFGRTKSLVKRGKPTGTSHGQVEKKEQTNVPPSSNVPMRYPLLFTSALGIHSKEINLCACADEMCTNLVQKASPLGRRTHCREMNTPPHTQLGPRHSFQRFVNLFSEWPRTGGDGKKPRDMLLPSPIRNSSHGTDGHCTNLPPFPAFVFGLYRSLAHNIVHWMEDRSPRDM